MSEKRIGIGGLGSGGRIREMMRILKARQPQVEVKAIFDPDESAVAATKREIGAHVKACASPDELVQRDDISWILIGSPNSLHREHSVLALNAGKHVFCEKPLAISLDDCVAIHDAWRGSGCKFVVGFTLRYAPYYRAIRQLLDQGIIGELISMEFNDILEWHHGGFIHRDWRRWRHLAGSHVVEKCCHDVDLAIWFAGSRAKRTASFGGLRFFTPENAYHMDRIGPGPNGEPAFCGWPGPPGNPFTCGKDIVDHQVAIIEFENMVRATFHTNCQGTIHERRMYLLGSEGAIRADVVAGTIEYQRMGWAETRHWMKPPMIGGHSGGDDLLADTLAECMAGGPEPITGLPTGISSSLTCLAMDESMDTGRIIDLSSYWAQLETGKSTPQPVHN